MSSEALTKYTSGKDGIKDLVKSVNSEYSNLPAPIQKGMEDVGDILNNELVMTDLYPKILTEIPHSTSSFQDKCVQYESHFTAHRKLRACMLEMDSKLKALYTAKTGKQEADIKVRRIQSEIDRLDKKIQKLETTPGNMISYADIRYRGLKISLDGFNSFDADAKEEIRHEVLEDLTFEIEKKVVKQEEALRNQKESSNLIKDAMLKVVQQRNLVEQYKKEVEETGMSFEESEAIYYVMYFTKESEQQIRTGGRVDTGTYSVICTMPDGLRLKILENIDFIQKKIAEGWDITKDYLHIVYREQLLPKKTSKDDEPVAYEGVNLEQFSNIAPVQVLSPDEQLSSGSEETSE